MSVELSVLQKRVADFVAAHNLEAPVQGRVLDLASEVGELAKEVNKSTGYGREPFREPSNDWQNELGDVFFALMCLANSTGVDLDATLGSVLRKYRERLDSGNDPGSGR